MNRIDFVQLIKILIAPVPSWDLILIRSMCDLLIDDEQGGPARAVMLHHCIIACFPKEIHDACRPWSRGFRALMPVTRSSKLEHAAS